MLKKTEREKREYIKTLQDKIEETSNKHYRIASFSKRYNDILMWAHYTNKHTGICMEFSYSGIDNFAQQYFCNIKQVRYRQKYYSLKEYNLIDPQDLITATKSKHWKYEKEWRLIYGQVKPIEENPFCLKFNPSMFTGIIFGCQITDDDRTYIQEKIPRDFPHVKLYQAERSYEEYALNINEITTNQPTP